MSKEKKTAALDNNKRRNEIKEAAEKAENPEKSSAESKRAFNKRGFKRGVLSAAFTVVFIAVIVVLNVIVGIVSDRVNTAADLTGGEIYTLDEKSKEFLNDKLDSDVNITVLKSEKDFESQDISYKQVNEILKKMAKTSEHIKLEYLDIDRNPSYTSKFKGETLAANYIVVESEKTGRHKILSPYEYFNFNQGYLQYYGRYVVESSNIEQEAVSAMMYTTNDRLVKVAFTEGYGESASGSALRALLTKNGYEVESLPLVTTPEISDDIDYVVIFAPSVDIDKEQLAKLDKFLDNGGKYGKNVVYFASTKQPKTPNIDEFLSDWGLAVGYDAIGQTDTSRLTSSETLFAHLQQLCDTEYTKTVYGSNLLTFGIHMRPVYTLKNSSAERVVLMKTYDKAYLYPLDKALAEGFDLDKAESGVFNDAAVAQRQSSDGVKSRVCVFGSEMFASSVYMSYTNSNNAEFFVGMWNYISGREQGITIKEKSFAAATFEINVKTANTLSVVLCVIIPVCIIVLGIVVWVRRRHR